MPVAKLVSGRLFPAGAVSAAFLLGMTWSALFGIGAAGNRTVEIIISGEGFSPRTAVISAGDTVAFINKDTAPRWPASNTHPNHDVYPEFDPKSELPPGGAWSFRFQKSGVWRYHDHRNPANGGTIEVKDAIEKKALSESEAAALMRQIEEEENEDAQLQLMRKLAYGAGPRTTIKLLNQSGLNRYGQTHLLSHVIGEAAYDVYREKGFEHCEADMLNGCVHGLILSAIADIGITGVGGMVEQCKVLSPFKYHMCLHATGHGFMALENYELPSALGHCERIIRKTDPDITHCFNGVFMENAHGMHDGRTPDTHPWLDAQNFLYPCDTVEHRHASDCYLNQAGWWYQLFGGDLEKTARQCAKVPENFRLQCANNFGRIVSTAVKNDPEEIEKHCRYLDGPRMREMCISAIAQSVFALGEETLPFVLCGIHATGAAKRSCYASLYLAFETARLSPEKKTELCGKIEPAYRAVCK